MTLRDSRTTTRRTFIIASAAVGAFTSTGAFAQAKVDEADEQAAALGYKHDTTKVDGKKFSKHDPKQHCANCQFWQGKASDEWAGCAMFGRKQIAKNGWCTAWAKAPNAS